MGGAHAVLRLSAGDPEDTRSLLTLASDECFWYCWQVRCVVPAALWRASWADIGHLPGLTLVIFACEARCARRALARVLGRPSCVSRAPFTARLGKKRKRE